MEVKNLFRRKWFRYGTNTTVLTVGVITASIFLYLLMERSSLRWDLTANKDLSLSEQTEQVLKRLDRDLTIIAFFGKGEDLDDLFIRRKVNDVLREYASRSSKIDYRLIDPNTEVESTTQHQVTTDGTIVFQSGENRKEIYKSQLFDYSKMSEKALPEFVGEGLFTNAILKVTRERQDKICFLEGHGERRTEDTSPGGLSETKGYLTKNNYEVMVFPLLTKETFSCDLLIVGGPERRFPDEEDRRIRDWVQKKGRLLLFIEPLTGIPLPQTLELLQLTPQLDLVLDPKRHFVLGPHFPSPLLADHEIAHGLEGTTPILSTVRSLTYKEKTEDFETIPLLSTSPEAWGETDLSGTEPRLDKKKDHQGPLTLGVVVRHLPDEAVQEESHQPVAVVVGDADFASNGLIQAPGNLDLFLNMIGWLVGDKDQIAIRPKTPEFRTISLTQGKARFITYFTQLTYPLVVLLGGGWFWYRRRRS